MIGIKNILTFSFVIIILFGCEELSPNVDFSEPVKGRLINLSNKVGDSFQIVRKADTISYFLYFDKLTDFNYLVKSDSDTVFVGTVTKKNELFLLNRLLKNGNYSIHALKFTDSTITGLETEWLQSTIIKNELDSGKYDNLIADTVGVNTLQTKKKDGKEIFRFVIEQLESERLVSTESEFSTNENNYLSSIFDNQEIKKTRLIHKVYPNPFTDQITIELSKEALYDFQIFDINGKQIKTARLNTDKMEMKMGDLKSGYYILKIISPTKTLDEIKILKK